MIVIPMAGLSRRFTQAGYAVPKYMLPLHGGTVFSHAISSFKAQFATTPFLFIARHAAEAGEFIEQQCERLGIADYAVCQIDRETAGQAETVELGLISSGVDQDAPVTIFNIDTIRFNFAFPDAPWFATSDGFLEVFRGEGDNWSYVAADPAVDEPLVLRTAEKQRISDLCSNGLYHFREAGRFLQALARERHSPQLAELYVAPLFNHVIQAGGRVHYRVVSLEQMRFCGVPAEYEDAFERAF